LGRAIRRFELLVKVVSSVKLIAAAFTITAAEQPPYKIGHRATAKASQKQQAANENAAGLN
jgi:hypothetical protein